MSKRRVYGTAAVTAAAVALAWQPAFAWEIEIGAPAQLVVGNAATLSAADSVLRLELVDLGYRVIVVDDNAPVSATSDTAVVVLSTSADVAALGSRYQSVEAPLVALGNNAWPDTALTAGTDGTSYDTTAVVVLDTTHPVATGLPAQFAPAQSTGALQSVNEAWLPDGADPVAARSGELAKHVVYTVSAGGALRGGYPAPAARVVLGYTAETVTDLSGAGYQLLENAVFWADERGTTVSTPTDPTQGTTEVGLLLKGRWTLDEIRTSGSRRITPSATKAGIDDGVLDADTTVRTTSRVALVGAGALYFPGWHHDADPDKAGVQVDPTDSSVRIPHQPYFTPADKQRFVVTAFVRPDDPTGGPQQPDHSPNIVQKGLRDDPGGQWKMFMTGDLRPGCDFVGKRPDGSTQTPRLFVPSQVELNAGSRYRITCELQPRRALLTVYLIRPQSGDEVRIINEPKDYTGTAPLVIDNNAQVWFGKKPGDTTVADTYAGAIDNVTIQRSRS